MEIRATSLREIVFKDERFAKFKDLKPDELREARKKNQKLDWALYDADKAQMFMDIAKEKIIAIKLSKGEKLTDEEQKFIEKNNSSLLEKAQMALTQADNLKQQNSTKLQTLSFIQNISKYDSEYGELLLNAYNRK